MKALFAAVLMMAPLAAQAGEYKCHTIRNEVTSYLVFDDGPGGLDDARLTVFGKNYKLVVFDEKNLIELVDSHDSFRNKYEYGGDELELGITAKDGMSIDIVTKRLHGQVFDGTAYIKTSQFSTVRKLPLTCLKL